MPLISLAEPPRQPPETSSDYPPGLIVFLYRRRWDLEKVYDQFKNKLNEKKSWASSLRTVSGKRS